MVTKTGRKESLFLAFLFVRALKKTGSSAVADEPARRATSRQTAIF